MSGGYLSCFKLRTTVWPNLDDRRELGMLIGKMNHCSRHSKTNFAAHLQDLTLPG